MINFKDQIVVVTGGSRGIGAETVALFAQLGANVVLSFKSDKKEAMKVVDFASKSGVECLAIQADMAKRSDCENLIDTTLGKFGQVDVLVNNAGIWTEAPIEQMSDSVLNETIDVNLKGCFYTTSAVVPEMKKRKKGSIIFVSSTAGQRGEAFHSHYAATKGALISLTKSLSSELAPYGIRTNCVAPGWVDTDMSHEALIGPDSAKYLSLIPLGRAASARELAGPIVFMASEWAGFITGEVLNVNGGAVLVG